MKELKRADKKRLDELINADNIAEILADDELTRIGQDVVDQYEQDEEDETRAERKEKWRKGQELAKQLIEEKNTPFENAANVKYPLLNIAAIQFNARAYPEIVQGNDVVKPKISGEMMPEKNEQAEQVSEFINWQLFNELEEWEEDTDRLLLMLPLYGSMFRKVWYSKERRRIATGVYTPEDLIVPPETQSLRAASRITTKFKLTPREVIEKVNSGHYQEVDYGFSDEDAEEPEDFVEQYKWLDLDDDGFKEPYIVVVHEESNQVARITANYTHEDVILSDDNKIYRINPRQYFVKYSFVPSTDGNFYDIGFFDLLYPINDVINTTINQLIDAGSLANRNTGFIGKEMSMRKRGPIKPKIGEFMPVNASGDDVRRGIVPMQFNGPDATLFNLLGFMVDVAKDIANIKEVLEGQTQNNMQPTTVMALIEQGLKVFSGIYKRIHRSLSDELQLIRKWNYFSKNPLAGEVVDVPFDVEWFNDEDLNFVPVSDAQAVTDLQRAARAQIYQQFMNDPYHDQMKLRTEYYKAQGLDFEPVMAGQDPQLQQMQQQIQQLGQAYQQLQEEYERFKQDKTGELKLDFLKEQREAIASKAEVKETIASAIEKIAKAEGVEEGTQLEFYKAIVEALDGQTGVSGMATEPSDAGSGRVAAG